MKAVEPGHDDLTPLEYAMRSKIESREWAYAYCFKDSLHVAYHGPSYENCCDPHFGPHGNPICWDTVAELFQIRFHFILISFSNATSIKSISK